jgi:zinc transport system permease protein
MMVLSSVLSAIFTVIGLWFSYVLDLTSGATIIAVAGIGFIISLAIERLWPKIAVK